MMTSPDGLISVEVMKGTNYWTASLPMSDVYVFNMPVERELSRDLLSFLSNSSSFDSVSLLTFRHTKFSQIHALANAEQIGEFKSLAFGDLVHLTYQTTTKRGFLSRLGEPAILVSKGSSVPTWEQTSWYREDAANAGNVWDLTPYDQDIKEPTPKTVFGQFAWDLGLLLLCLVYPMRHRRIVWGQPHDENLLKFAKAYQINIVLFAPTMESAEKLLKQYGEI